MSGLVLDQGGEVLPPAAYPPAPLFIQSLAGDQRIKRLQLGPVLLVDPVKVLDGNAFIGPL